MLTETLIKIPVIDWSIIFLALTPHWLQCKWAKIYLSQAALSMTLLDHGGLPVCISRVRIAAVGSLKRVTVRILKTSN